MLGTLAHVEAEGWTGEDLMDGSHDLASFLVEGVGAPVRIEQVQLSDQPVVLPQEERVQRNHSQMLVGSGIPWETVTMSTSPAEAKEENKHLLESLTSLEAGRGVLVLACVRSVSPAGAVSRAAGVQASLQSWQEGHEGQLLVRVLGVVGHRAQWGGEVSQSRGLSGGAAVHHAGVYKGSDGVELLSAVMREDASDAAGSRAKKWHAALEAMTRI